MWEEVVEGLPTKISFYESHLSFEGYGDVYNVYLRSKYSLNDEFTTKLTVQCRMVEGHIEVLNKVTRVHLFFSNDGVVSNNDSLQTTDKSNTSSERKYLWVIAVVIVVVMVLAVWILLVVFKGFTNKKRKRRAGTGVEEGLELLPPQGKRKLFVANLKETYKNQYDAIQPIPYIRERLFCVGKVFVEGGFEFLHQSVGQKGHEIWEHLKSYHDIFQNDHLKSSRRILEGEPGYGKSTLALQMAYEWCESIPESPMQTVGILIFLRMRQLEGVSSIYKAIKRFLLAKDTRLDESDIEDILSNTSSVLFILDGFDEFPGSIDECESHFDYIIRNEMFQKFDVILTTRSSCLPNNYAPSSKRIRLTGFDDRARNDYIRKAVVGHDTGVDNTEVVDGIKTRLEENPVLNDLCQVPLLFVMFAHMTYEKEEFQKFNSVTSFFKHMIASFHSHMKNKMKDRNVRKWNVNEVNHQKLDEIAFEGLTSTYQKTTWNKEELSIRTGEKFYRQYRDLGILVEEDVLDIGGKSGVDFTYKKKTRFYHKLFCEWYAAHHLADILGNHGKETNNKKPNKVLNAEETKKLLESLNPFDLQYVFRFACGLNNDAAGIIIQYLQRTEEFEKFAVLCILERDDKTENIVESVRDLCSSTINITGNDSLLLQRSSIQLLEIAAANGIIVSRVCLTNSFKSVNVPAGRLHLTSELYLPALSTIKEILIRERARTMTEEEIETLLKFATKCKRLKTIM
ncbi:NLR family CARD domain-containing protein 4 [Holothuria leucospilota]|uniref:NLR family CARD domain-containing protein 4 n=1 Tax=Holothuria leucospilota TaxID=206669 RepID=A0A9Q1CPP5_HOLLE|nr:NLR family CARD domain-containing protein 4 [Holothuria leucospilota]